MARGSEQGAKERESERRRKRNSPMVLPYGKSPTAMVNAHVIGGRYTGIITGSQKVTMNYSKFALQPQYAKNPSAHSPLRGPRTAITDNKRRFLTPGCAGRAGQGQEARYKGKESSTGSLLRGPGGSPFGNYGLVRLRRSLLPSHSAPIFLTSLRFSQLPDEILSVIRPI